jgi:MFS family permease
MDKRQENTAQPHAFKRIRMLYYAFTTLFVMHFVFTFHHLSIAYVNATFLSQFTSPEVISILYSVFALVSSVTLILAPYVIGFIGVRSLLIILIPLLQAVVLFLGLSHTIWQAGFLFVSQGVIFYFLLYLLDLYIEGATTDESQTGNVRGIILSIGNIGAFLAPLAIGFFVIDEFYPPIYTFAALLLIPAFALAITSLKHLTPHIPRRDSFVKAFRELRICRSNVAYILIASLFVQTFFGWLMVYGPLVMFEVGGYSWQVIGVLTALALLPYIILEFPLGVIADRYIGEKEILICGFLCASIALVLLAFIPLAWVLVWGAVFIFTRVGGAMLEIATESYFFKQVRAENTALVSLFRITRSLGLIVGPLIATAFIPFTGLHTLLAVFGAIMLAGIPVAIRIEDTK